VQKRRYGRCFPLTRTSPEALTLLGSYADVRSATRKPKRCSDASFQLEPASLLAHRNLASALIAQNKPDAAIEEYVEVVRLAPQDHAAKIELARLYLSRGQFAEALSSLASIPKDSFPPDAIPAQAAALLGLGKREQAAALIPRTKRSPVLRPNWRKSSWTGTLQSTRFRRLTRH